MKFHLTFWFHILQLKDLTVAALKTYLSAHNLPVGGKKEALITRILTHMGKWAKLKFEDWQISHNVLLIVELCRLLSTAKTLGIAWCNCIFKAKHLFRISIKSLLHILGFVHLSFDDHQVEYLSYICYLCYVYGKFFHVRMKNSNGAVACISQVFTKWLISSVCIYPIWYYNFLKQWWKKFNLILRELIKKLQHLSKWSIASYYHSTICTKICFSFHVGPIVNPYLQLSPRLEFEFLLW